MACSGLRRSLLSEPSLLVALGPAPPSLGITGEGGDQRGPPFSFGAVRQPNWRRQQTRCWLNLPMGRAKDAR